MSQTLTATLPITRWQADRGTYHLVTFSEANAETLAEQALIERLEFGRSRGFGSLKVTARIGDTEWHTSVFPQKKQNEWVLLISHKVMRAEGLETGQPTTVHLAL